MKNIILKLVVFVIVVGATVLVIFYAKGYRMNFVDNVVVKTGILHLETEPRRANFWLTEGIEGRTPEIVTSIPGDKYTLDVWLDEYHGIKYDIEIFAERSTPLSVFLFRKNPDEEILKKIQGEILDIHIESSRNNAFLLVEESINENQKNYEILKYQTNTKFWQFGTNPSTLFTFSIHPESVIESTSISPNSKNVLITITNPQKVLEDEELLSPGKYILALDTKTIIADITEITDEIKWSHDGETIIWRDTEGINKLNLKEPDLPTLVYTPTEDTEIIYYDSYTNGEIYLLLKTEENSFVSLSRVSEELEKTFLVEKIYYQAEERFIESWKEMETIPYQTFTNSPQSTLFVGQPKEFLISKENQSVIFNTEFASYMYSTEENSYIMINPYKTEILNFSPDGKKIAFLSLENEKLGFFRFDKEINNYSTKLGGNYLASYISKEDCSDFAWHQNSQNIYYVCENSLYATDIMADFNTKIVPEFGEKIMLDSKNKVVTLIKDEEILNITSFQIN